MLLLQTACSSSRDDAVEGSLTVVDRTTSALTELQIISVNGVYAGGCNNRTTGNPWSVALPGGTMDHAPLIVIRNDTSCTLTLTDITYDGTAGPTSPDAVPAIPLEADYQDPASSFEGGVFYANAKLSALDFAANFSLTLLYSDDAAFVNRNKASSFALSQATLIAESVPAPGIALDLGLVLLTVDVDNLLVSATGAAGVTNLTMAGDAGVGALTYFVVTDPDVDLDDYLAIDAAYLAADRLVLGATLDTAEFGLIVGNPMPQVRRLVVANTVEDVRSYSVTTISFNGVSLP